MERVYSVVCYRLVVILKYDRACCYVAQEAIASKTSVLKSIHTDIEYVIFIPI